VLLACLNVACSGKGGGGKGVNNSDEKSINNVVDKSINSVDEFKAYLDKQPANSPDKPIKVSMKANDLMINRIVEVLFLSEKYVSLDLSRSSMTTIPAEVFFQFESLVGIIIPDSVTSIGDNAFQYCYRLTSVTFASNIPSNGFANEYS
jgi:hypothetical protein